MYVSILLTVYGLRLVGEFWVRKRVEIWQFKSKFGRISGLEKVVYWLGHSVPIKSSTAMYVSVYKFYRPSTKPEPRLKKAP